MIDTAEIEELIGRKNIHFFSATSPPHQSG